MGNVAGRGRDFEKQSIIAACAGQYSEPMQLMQRDTYLPFLFEQSSWFTVVLIDGRKRRAGIATWFGHSVGHWKATRS
jgi:hypothetical protein